MFIALYDISLTDSDVVLVSNLYTEEWGGAWALSLSHPSWVAWHGYHGDQAHRAAIPRLYPLFPIQTCVCTGQSLHVVHSAKLMGRLHPSIISAHC
jgi:hypothetical protein